MSLERKVKKAQKGNVAAFEELVVEQKQSMYLTAKSILKQDPDCADAMQEAIIKAFQNIHNLKEPIYFKTWLLRIVKNESYQILRKQKNLVYLEDWIEPIYQDVKKEQFEFQLIFSKMTPEQQEILNLFYTVGLSIRELAEVLNIPENTVKSRMHRARQKMKELWTEEEEGEHSWKNGKNT